MIGQDVLKSIIAKIIEKMADYSYAIPHPQPLPIGVSNRHIHLTEKDKDVLFGEGYQLQVLRDLSQTGQYATKDLVTIAGPGGTIERVRVLGPIRKGTQVEVSRGDAIRLGLKPPVRESGDIAGSSPVTIIGPKGSVYLEEGLIIAKRHIHMAPSDAQFYGVSDGDVVRVKTAGERGTIFDQVSIRVNPDFVLEFHIDIDEANSAGVNNGGMAYLIKNRIYKDEDMPKETEIPLSKKPQNLNKESTRKNKIISLITDEMVRQAHKDSESLVVNKGAIYTPLARDTIKELGVKVVIGE